MDIKLEIHSKKYFVFLSHRILHLLCYFYVIVVSQWKMAEFKTISKCNPWNLTPTACIEYFHQFPKENTKFHLPANFANWRLTNAGALVSVNCQSHATERTGKSMVANGVTDEFGDFMVDLPSYLHAIPNLEKICRVKVHKIPKGSLCRPARHVNKQKGLLKLSTIGNGIRTYDAGTIRIQHSASELVRASPRKDIGEIKE